ncbi:TetR/AcrR family transcriptional regulator [Pelagibacterium halotolerans]|uniref:Transcriptional regulator, TetR family n=1 Tax=Pelagibacterium halotolerans (strain DSM 22347 / JCM 15775 / CGMCC 1.7692 / B2) TaxID=1082931 RepID=G4R9K8_PELHB|nr:TetR/AcrR family transcriptional regulator [Pelagibacterium halotolerans]AEQ50428.1 transcriptional regulator, TetR family [Pelagibacterium halotolerans B2]QJR19605.1 TetR/AcrR family transcriptional regulator [Pelagibacterium halotolerans]SDZ86883.1 transcriptional regulator, TetR family [Pelagibacterium halotolerans]
MQEGTQRRSNRDRSEATRAALIAAGRVLFVERPYGEIGTPEIVGKAGVTRGALYHHFADKQALFAAVVDAESAAVAVEIEQSSPQGTDPVEALLAGGRAYLDAMAMPGRTRLLLLDAPAVLGHAEAGAIDMRHSARTLHDGLGMAIAAGVMPPLPLGPLTQVISSAFDRAALAIEAGASRTEWENVLESLLSGLAGGR